MTQRPGGKNNRLSHYELHEQIGAGGMGSVYRALDRRSGVPVAVKVVHPHLQVDTAYIDRFRREAHIASLLSSPYVVRILDFGFDKGQYFMVTEFVTGTKLTDILRPGRLDPLQALAITAQVALALDEAEGRGVVHRDIKPDNIIITPDNSVKVLDFGIARQAGMQGVTVTGVFVGTLQYSSPEQFAGHADIRSDIYALGVTLFYMLSGELPFTAASPTALMRMHEDAPPPLDKLAGLPGAVVDLVGKMLAKSPSDRYQHVSQLLAAMEMARQSLTGARTDSWMADATSVIAPTHDEAPSPTHAAGPRPQTDETVLAPHPTGASEVTQLQTGGAAAAGVSSEVTQLQQGASGVPSAGTSFEQTQDFSQAARGGTAASGGGAVPPAGSAATRQGEGRGGNRMLLILGGAAAVIAIVVVGGIFAISTLGGGGDGEDDDNGSSSSNSGNGDEEDDRPTPRPTQRPTPDGGEPPVSDAEFDAAAAAAAPQALLNADDLGEGWTGSPPLDLNRDYQNVSAPCQALVEETFPGQSVYQLSDEYTGPENQSSRSDIFIFRTEFDADDAANAIDDAFGEPCFEELAPELERVFLAEVQAAGSDITAFDVSISEQDDPDLGDYSSGSRFTIVSESPAGSATFYSDVITMRVGRLISNVYYEHVEPDEEALAAIAESVAEKMRGVDESLP